METLLAMAPSLIVLALLIAGERLRAAPRTDWWINLQAWLVNLAAGYTVYAAFHAWHGRSLIDPQQLPVWAAIVIFVVVNDLGEYLFHRAQHRIPLLWAMHSLHHSDPEMSALTTSRHFWGDRLFKTFTVWSASAMIIAPTRATLAAYGAISLWNYFTHARLNVDFGRWSWVINSPAYHRRHHSALPEHYDSNFAALFPIFDVIAGSYHRPDGFPPTGYAIRPRNLREVLTWPLHHWRAEAAAADQPPPHPRTA